MNTVIVSQKIDTMNLQFEKKFVDDPFAEMYGSDYKNAISELESMIIEQETGSETFAVINFEPSLGKSVQTNRIIKEYLGNFEISEQRNFLIVKRFKKDVYDCKNGIGDNTWFGQDAVLGITSENWNEWKNRTHMLKEFRVLIITHERYISLCENEELRKEFTSWRHTLVLDEKIEFPIYLYSNQTYNIMVQILPFELHEQLINVCKPLINLITKIKIQENSNMKCIVCRPYINFKKLTSFRRNVEDNMNHIKRERQREVVDFLNTLEVLYSNKCLYNGERISAVNPKHKLWGLQNNLILDANGDIDYSYKINPKILIYDQPKIIDHSDSCLYWIKCNSSYSSINKNEDEFFEGLSKLIDDLKIVEKKTLIVTHKKCEKKLIEHLNKLGINDVGLSENYSGEQFAVDHFGNLIGKNTYRNFKQCWIVGTPNIPMEAYIHKWKQYREESYGKYDKSMVGKNDALRFVSKEYEKMRTGYLVGEIFQCVKRIQRNPNPKAEIYIVTNAKDIFLGVACEMKNIEIGEKLTLSINPKAKPAETKEPTKIEKKVQELLSLIETLDPGKYTKKFFMDTLGIKNNFNRILNNIDIDKLVISGKIEVGNKFIVVH